MIIQEDGCKKSIGIITIIAILEVYQRLQTSFHKLKW
jgi:hypothetical protein